MKTFTDSTLGPFYLAENSNLPKYKHALENPMHGALLCRRIRCSCLVTQPPLAQIGYRDYAISRGIAQHD
jgi:hypothetical protein